MGGDQLTQTKIRGSVWLACLALIALVWIVFGQTLGHEFVNYDDNTYVFENSHITSGITLRGMAWALTHSHSDNWHPLTSLSHMLDCDLYGLRPWGHHLSNVLLHSIAVVLCFLVLEQMTGALWRSAFVASLFAIHPLHVESVAWISERKDVLSGVFFMLTLGAYLRYVRQPGLTRYLTTAALFAAGLMAKPTLVTLPFVLLLLDYWPLRRFRSLFPTPRLILEKLPLLALAAASCVATLLAQQQIVLSIERLPLLWRVNNALVSYLTYVWQTVWPTRLAVFYPHPKGSFSSWEIVSGRCFADRNHWGRCRIPPETSVSLGGLALVFGNARAGHWNRPGWVSSTRRSLHVFAATRPVSGDHVGRR